MNADMLDYVLACEVCRETTSLALEKDGFPVRRCQRCEFLFVAPRPPESVVLDHYAQNYRGANETFYPKAFDRKWRGFWQSLLFIPYAAGRRVLDLGCGGGFMVDALGRFAREAVGVDISENSIAYAKRAFPRHRFYAEPLSEFARRGEQFDFVFSSEVLEHVLDPREFMMTLRDCVRPNGFAYISAPDAGHPAVPADLAQWGDICPPEHLQWFNFRNLTWLFAEYGFVPHRRSRSRTPSHSVIFQKVAA
jgi:SAM-dependent methyltransferase